ncbi:Brp/Blh family beta-carotene 15,15'-dioxygenase [Polynucleobacter sp.]|uniref:Brp/Blh family beta-carotene 15,15'-dioxygenase n=1 Tax=Polynucleobacter sp. TaxID=2029855 RepID=UPI0033419788
MNQIKAQGICFSILAIGIVIISIFWQPTDSLIYLIILAIIIFFLGVPHGALDPIFAKKLLPVSTWQSWSYFVLLYGLLGLVMIIFWVFSPLLFMITFLCLSVLHFSRDLENTAPKITKLLYGSAVIVLPTLLHYDVMVNLFTLILNQNDGLLIVNFLHTIALPYLILLILSIAFETYRNTFQAMELVAVSLLAIFVQPLMSFTIFFCGMHSVRHMLRTQYYSQLGWKKILLTSLLPMLGVVLIALLSWIFLLESPNYPRILQLIFVGLACLTVPHMLLVDRVQHPNH